MLAASVAGVRASQRRGKHRGTALKQAAATKELVVEERADRTGKEAYVVDRN